MNILALMMPEPPPVTDEFCLIQLGELARIGLAYAGTNIFPKRSRVVVENQGFLELGTVLKSPYFDDQALRLGNIIRSAEPHESYQTSAHQQRHRECCTTFEELTQDTPISLVDAELSWDRRRLIVHVVMTAQYELDPLLDQLARRWHVTPCVVDLAITPSLDPTPEPGNSCSTGGCTSRSCGSGGCDTTSSGCGTSCGRKMPPEELTTYFQALRQDMERKWTLPQAEAPA